MIGKVIQGQCVARGVETGASLDHFRSGPDGFQNFHDDALGGEKARCAAEKSRFIGVDKGFRGGAGERLQIEERGGIDDDAARGFGARLEYVAVACAKEQFVGEDLQIRVENGLASDETFVHAKSSGGRKDTALSEPQLERKACGGCLALLSQAGEDMELRNSMLLFVLVKRESSSSMAWTLEEYEAKMDP